MKPATIGDIVLVVDDKRETRPAIVLRTHERTTQLDLRILGIFGDATDFGVPHSPTPKIGHWTPKP